MRTGAVPVAATAPPAGGGDGDGDLGGAARPRAGRPLWGPGAVPPAPALLEKDSSMGPDIANELP